MDIRGKRIVVLGGAGLIGSHTVDLLTQEDVEKIIIYDDFSRGTMENLESAFRDPRVSVYDAGGDICRVDTLQNALKGANGVFHFAALWLLHCNEYPRSAFDVNIMGTFNVLETCVAAGVERLVNSSSASVYGEALEAELVEDQPFDNRNFYGATKIAGEAMVRAFFHRYRLQSVSLRYMNVYGPRQDFRSAYMAVVMRMLNAIDQDEPITIFGDGSEAYDFVYVRDCAAANICAVKSETVDRCFNVGTGKPTTLRELADLLLELSGKSLPIRYVPNERIGLVNRRIGSTDRATKELGFTAATQLRTGLEELMKWRSRERR